MKLLWKNISIVSIAIIATVLAASPVFAYNPTEYHWDATSTTYDDEALNSTWRTEIGQAASTWSNAGANFGFTLARGSSSNDLFIGTCYDPDHIGETRDIYLYSGTTHLYTLDTCFNEDEPFSVGGGDDTWDIETVALHEFGHWLILDETGNFFTWLWDHNKVMYYAYTGVKTTLHQDDIDGIVYMYDN